MKLVKKIFIVLLICCLACSGNVFAGENEKTDSEDNAFYTEMVNKAIEVLAEAWNETYSNGNYTTEEYRVDIRNTRIICIKDVLEETEEKYFGNVEYIIEFMIFDDTFSAGGYPSGYNAGYYSYSGVDDNVVVYRDGQMECKTQAITRYRSQTFKYDYSTFIEQIIDLHDQFNQVIRFKEGQVFMEK